jgi:hypothetical protein
VVGVQGAVVGVQGAVGVKMGGRATPPPAVSPSGAPSAARANVGAEEKHPEAANEREEMLEMLDQYREKLRKDRGAKEQSEQQQVRQQVEAYQKELQRHYETYPEFKPAADVEVEKQKPEVKFAVKWMTENLDEGDLKRLREDPVKRMPLLFKLLKTAWRADRAALNEAELKKLRGTLQKAQGPVQAGGNVESDGSGNLKESDEIKRQIEERFS